MRLLIVISTVMRNTRSAEYGIYTNTWKWLNTDNLWFSIMNISVLMASFSNIFAFP